MTLGKGEPGKGVKVTFQVGKKMRLRKVQTGLKDRGGEGEIIEEKQGLPSGKKTHERERSGF